MSKLSGMKEICRYCNRSESTILIWIRDYDFPAAKLPGSYESDTELIDEWRVNLIRHREGIDMMPDKVMPKAKRKKRKKKV